MRAALSILWRQVSFLGVLKNVNSVENASRFSFDKGGDVVNGQEYRAVSIDCDTNTKN